MNTRERSRSAAPISVGVPRRILKARKKRAEKWTEAIVRAKCVERDGYCRIGCIDSIYQNCIDHDKALTESDMDCAGASQWTHMHARLRSQTRNMAPEVRHSTRYSFMACQRHHDQYDGRQRPRLFVTALTAKGADGPLKFRMGKS